jgi:hypothetical protein
MDMRLSSLEQVLGANRVVKLVSPVKAPDAIDVISLLYKNLPIE